MIRFALLALLALVQVEGLLLVQDEVKPNPSKGKGGAKGTFASEKIKVKDVDREYRLVVPDGIDPEKPVPLVFAFHGLKDSKDTMPMYCKLGDLAAAKNFVLVYPNGIDKKWEMGPGEENTDLAFFDELFTFIGSKYNIDLNRVYLTGMSMGGFFAHIVAARRSEKIAAIGPHSSALGEVALKGINAKRKYPVIMFQGDKDRIVSAERAKMSRDIYKKEGHDVEYVELEGQGHIWGTKENNDKLWDFFVAHPLK